MFYKTQSFMTPLHVYVQEHCEALQNVALLLGGRPYLRLAGNLITDLQSDPIVTQRVKVNALALHSLLSLEHVHDFDRPEAAYFSELDPEMPYIDEICLLTDGLTHALCASNILPDGHAEADAFISETEIEAITGWERA